MKKTNIDSKNENKIQNEFEKREITKFNIIYKKAIERFGNDIGHIIIECQYDFTFNSWIICKPRFDKQNIGPNFIKTCESTQKVIEEDINKNILIDSLKY